MGAFSKSMGWSMGICFCLISVVCFEVSFKQHIVVQYGAEWWWARCHKGVNKDGLMDFFVVNNNYLTLKGYVIPYNIASA